MDTEEIRRTLETCRTLHVATVGPDGSPHLAPVYFVLLDGAVTFWTYGKSQKAVNLRRDPRLCCMVEDGEESAHHNDLRAVMIRGTARIDESPHMVEKVGIALHVRYMGSVVGPAELADVRRRGRKRVVIQVPLERTVSWDHAKLVP
jgi:PPOX class probable F420-dependent enzyme